MPTGYAERWLSSRIACSNSSAGPPPGIFMARSAISQSSSRARTGWLTRTSSPAASIASMNCRSVSSGITGQILPALSARADMNGRDAEGQRRPPHIRKARGHHACCKLRLARKVRHGARQIAIGRVVTAHESTDEWHDLVKVELIGSTHEPESRRRELQNDELRARPEHPTHLPQREIELRDIANAERHDRAVHAFVANR